MRMRPPRIGRRCRPELKMGVGMGRGGAGVPLPSPLFRLDVATLRGIPKIWQTSDQSTPATANGNRVYKIIETAGSNEGNVAGSDVNQRTTLTDEGSGKWSLLFDPALQQNYNFGASTGVFTGSSYSLFAVMKATTLPGPFGFIIARDVAGNRYGSFGVAANGAGFNIKVEYPGASSVTGSTLLTAATWYLIELEVTGTSVKLFLNGVEDGSATIDLSGQSAGGGLYFGAREFVGSEQFFAGNVASLRVYTYLSDDDKALVRTNMNLLKP